VATTYGIGELLAAMVVAFGAPRPTSFGLGELLEDLVQAIEGFSIVAGGFTNLQLGNPAVDNAVQINSVFASGQPVLNNQNGVCYISSPIIIPPGLGIWTPYEPLKQGGNFYVPGLRIMAAPGFSGAIPSAAQNAYGLPPSLDALVIHAGISSWMSGVTVDGSLNPTTATPNHAYPVALYNTDVGHFGCLIRQATAAALCDIGDTSNTTGAITVYPQTNASANPITSVTLASNQITVQFSGPLPAFLGQGPGGLGQANNMGINLVSGITAVGGTLPPNPINLAPVAPGATSVTFNVSSSITSISAPAPSVSFQFVGAARYRALHTHYESGTNLALQVSGVDTKMTDCVKLQGLAAFNAQGLDVTGMHLTGQGGSVTYAGNTGQWNTVVAARGQMVKAIFDTIPGGSSGLIGYMNNDGGGDPFVFDACEYHMNNPSVQNVPIVNRITTGPGQRGTAPLQINAGSAYAANLSIFASPTAGKGGLIDTPNAGDQVTELQSPSTSWILHGSPPNPSAATFFGTGTQPLAYSIDINDVPLWVSNIAGPAGSGYMPGVVANDPTTDYGPIINTYMGLINPGDTLPLPPGTIYTSTEIVPPQGVILVGSGWAEDITQEGTTIQPRPGSPSPNPLVGLINPESGIRNLNVDGLAHNVTGSVGTTLSCIANKCRATQVGLYGGANYTANITGEGFRMNEFRCDTMAAGPGPAGSITVCIALTGSDGHFSNGVMANGTKFASGDQTLWSNVHFTSASGGALPVGTNANVCDQGGNHFSSCEFDSLPASPTIPLTAMIDRTGATFPSTYASCRVMQSTNLVTGMPVFLETTHAGAGVVVAGMTGFLAGAASGSSFTNFVTGAIASTQVTNVTLPSGYLSSTFTDVVPPLGSFFQCGIGGTAPSMGGSIPGGNLISTANVVSVTTNHTAIAGEWTQFGGSTTAQTITLPTSPATGTINQVSNTSTTYNNILTVSSGGGVILYPSSTNLGSNNIQLAPGDSVAMEYRGSSTWQILTLEANNPMPVINAVTMGADPTGSFDSAPAINNCITNVATLGGGTVYLPPGTYKINTSLICGNTTYAESTYSTTTFSSGTATQMTVGNGSVFAAGGGTVGVFYGELAAVKFNYANRSGNNLATPTVVTGTANIINSNVSGGVVFLVTAAAPPGGWTNGMSVDVMGLTGGTGWAANANGTWSLNGFSSGTTAAFNPTTAPSGTATLTNAAILPRSSGYAVTTGTLSTQNSVTLRGASPPPIPQSGWSYNFPVNSNLGTVLKWNGSSADSPAGTAAMIRLVGPMQGVLLENLFLDATNGATPALYGVYAQSLQASRLRNLYVYQAAKANYFFTGVNGFYAGTGLIVGSSQSLDIDYCGGTVSTQALQPTSACFWADGDVTGVAIGSANTTYSHIRSAYISQLDPQSEYLTVTGNPTAMTLTWNSHTTASIAMPASAATVLAALALLSGWPAGASASGGPLGTTTMQIFGMTSGLGGITLGSFTGGSSPALVVQPVNSMGFNWRFCDDIMVRDTTFVNSNVAPVGNIFDAFYDFTNILTGNCPMAIVMDGIQSWGYGAFAHNNTSYSGTPGSPNVVRGLSTGWNYASGVPANPPTPIADPGVLNLKWEVPGGPRNLAINSTSYLTSGSPKCLDALNPVTLTVNQVVASVNWTLTMGPSTAGTLYSLHPSGSQSVTGGAFTYEIPAGWFVVATFTLNDVNFTAFTRTP
jgi:hypothetical protein